MERPDNIIKTTWLDCFKLRIRHTNKRSFMVKR
jgi:hypothetical protein